MVYNFIALKKKNQRIWIKIEMQRLKGSKAWILCKFVLSESQAHVKNSAKNILTPNKT